MCKSIQLYNYPFDRENRFPEKQRKKEKKRKREIQNYSSNAFGTVRSKQFPVFFLRVISPEITGFDHDKKGTDAEETDESRSNKTVLDSCVVHKRCDTIIHGEIHGISDNNQKSDG